MKNFDNRIDVNDPSLQEENTTYKFKDLDMVEIEDVNIKDYPDFSDAFFSYAEINGRPLTDEELDNLTDNYPDELNQMAHEYYI